MAEKVNGDLSIWTGTADPNKWTRQRVGIGVTAQCTAFCRFCERNQDLGEGLDIVNFPKSELFARAEEIIKDKKRQAEFVLTGGIIGEPLLKDVDYLKEIIITIKSACPDSNVRINTTGNMLNREESEELLRELKETELDSVSVSLNASSEKDYNYLCRPKGKGSYSNALSFIESSLKVLRVEGTFVSFVNYSEHPEAPKDWPTLNKQSVNKLLLPMGVSENNIIFRDYIPLRKKAID